MKVNSALNFQALPKKIAHGLALCWIITYHLKNGHKKLHKKLGSWNIQLFAFVFFFIPGLGCQSSHLNNSVKIGNPRVFTSTTVDGSEILQFFRVLSHDIAGLKQKDPTGGTELSRRISVQHQQYLRENQLEKTGIANNRELEAASISNYPR